MAQLVNKQVAGKTPQNKISATKIAIFYIGNPSRGDDGAACALQAKLAQSSNNLAGVIIENQWVYQLCPEHIYDMEPADVVVFVDATVRFNHGCKLETIIPTESPALASHALSPNDLTGFYESLLHKKPPPCLLLSIGATEFELTEKISPMTQENIHMAEDMLLAFLRKSARR